MAFTNEDALEYYTQINAFVTTNLKKVNDKDELNVNQFWSAVLSLTADKIREKVKESDVSMKECDVAYMNNPIEYRGWNVALIVMSWLLHNLKMKTENGQCHNTKHEHGARLPRKCSMGSELHNNLYTECLKSFKGIIELFENNPPKLGS